MSFQILPCSTISLRKSVRNRESLRHRSTISYSERWSNLSFLMTFTFALTFIVIAASDASRWWSAPADGGCELAT